MAELDLEDFKHQRRNVKSSITRIQTAVTTGKELNQFQLQTHLETVTELFKQYDKVQFQIEKLMFNEEGIDETALERENDKEREKVETQYHAIVSKIKSLLITNGPGTSNESSNGSTVINITNKNDPNRVDSATNLEPLPLPTFAGKYSEWYAFYDSFSSLVGNNPNISNIRKFYYLRGCLKDEALRSIESLSISEDNYQAAIEQLQRRFENKRLIVQEHISNILNIGPILKSSREELRQLIDTVNNNLAALKILGLQTQHWDALLIGIVFEKLDYITKKEWQTNLEKEIPSFKQFNEFLEKRYQILEATNKLYNKNLPPENNFKNSQSNFKNSHFNKQVSRSPLKQKPHKFNANVIATTACFICKNQHTVFQCADFLNMPVADRIKYVEKLKLCPNCLRNNHTIQQCKSVSVCKECKQKHHSLLHINEFVPSPSVSTLYISNTNQVLFSTMLVLIEDRQGQLHECRAVLDQCSEVCLLTNNMCKKLNLPTNVVNTIITGVNISENSTNQCVNVKIKSRLNEFNTNISCFVLPKITRPTPATSFDKSLIEIPPNMKLADPNFNISQNIDLLIGAQLFWKLLIGSPIQMREGQPYLQKTKFGWIVGGNFEVGNNHLNVSCNVISQIEANLESQIETLWDNENSNEKSTNNLESKKCEEHFCNNTYRATSGRFVVKLPFKGTINLGDSRTLAVKRFLSQEKRFEKDIELKVSYKNFMTEYFQLGHMERVPRNEWENPNSYYLPHLAVYKQTIEGPKIRVVFDASARSSNGLSLNDNLLTGETLQQDLFSILCRFRTYQFAISADIKKMYRMVDVDPLDTNYQRILWRENPNDEIQTYRLKTVTYGTTCAPFLAVRCLKQLAIVNRDSYPLASEIIDRDFYMDDLLTGSNSVEEALLIKNQVTNILASACFELCKWAANDPRLICQEPSSIIDFYKNDEVKVLGFYWNCKNDELKYKVELPVNHSPITKRTILSTVAKIFDPLGIINPIVVKIKILLQQLWTLKLNWDEAVPHEMETIWKRILNELPVLNNYRIPRNLSSIHSTAFIELHGFSDASMKAYGAAIFLKTTDEYGNCSINLICAKSRVAPLKNITLPKLELNAAVLLATLMSKISEILNIKINKRYFWTDSTIVLCWLAEPACNWKQYIANRVVKIQEVSSTEEWRHVKSHDNAADIVSRGVWPKQLEKLELWWYGPQWLQLPENEWPSNNNYSINRDETLLERRSKIVNVVSASEELLVMSKFSSFNKLKRVIAYCLRFCNNLRNKTKNKSSVLSVQELELAKVVILRYIQSRNFPDEIKDIQKSGKINKSSKLSKLDPFLDDKGLLRVGGRLKHAPLDYDHKFPVLLPKNHHITNLIVRNTHESELHAGNQATLASLRQSFWPLAARDTVRKILRNCVVCNRVNPQILTQKMGDLPKQRLEPIRPFYVCGVDYAGPFLIKDGKTRNKKKVKSYVALFICFATKAVHIELVGDLTTESFLAAFKRFTARRGHVIEIYSDNGTNFIGAERELFKSEAFQTKINNHFATKNTKFNFIPARSPHFGGLWERAVQSVKHHLRRAVGDASLTYEEFYTILTRVEACLNSRPLTPLSPDPNDLEALTPGHFLIGAPMTSPVEVDLTDVSTNRLSRWQRVQQVQQHFWRRWQKEYLSQLQVRPKGQQTKQPNISPGALVALVEDNLPPLKWRLARVVEVHPGSDGVVRVVSVKTTSGISKRAIKKVCVIPA